MALDVFSHFLPPAALARMRELAPTLPALAAFERLPELWDAEARLRSLDQFPDVQQVLNYANPPVETFGSPVVAARLARIVNDELASLCATHPERFPTFTAVLPMNDIDLALVELGRSLDVLGARGVQLYTNVLGAPLSHKRFRPIFEEMARRDLPILVHPFRTHHVADYAVEDTSRDEVWFTFGWPYETSVFAARMVFSGLFEDFPDIKVVLHHFGAMIPSFAARIDLGFQQIFTGTGGANPLAEQAGLTGTVAEHYHRFYADTALNGSLAGIQAGYAFFGPDRSVFGSDAPFCQDGGPSFVGDSIRAIEALDLPATEQHRVLDGNGRALFKLDPPDATAAPAATANGGRP